MSSPQLPWFLREVVLALQPCVGHEVWLNSFFGRWSKFARRAKQTAWSQTDLLKGFVIVFLSFFWFRPWKPLPDFPGFKWACVTLFSEVCCVGAFAPPSSSGQAPAASGESYRARVREHLGERSFGSWSLGFPRKFRAQQKVWVDAFLQHWGVRIFRILHHHGPEPVIWASRQH